MSMSNNKNEETIFETLSNELSVEERNELYEKIKPMYKEADPEVKSVQDKESKRSELVKYTDNIYNKKSFFYKLLVFLTQLIKGTTKAGAISEIEIINVGKDIKTHYGDYIDTHNNTLTSSFIKQFVQLATICAELSKILENVIHQMQNYSGFITWIIEKNLPESLAELFNQIYPAKIINKTDFVTKERYISERDVRLKKYFNKIDTDTFTNLNDQMTRLEILYKLIDYDFKNLFLCFSLSSLDAKITAENKCKYIDVDREINRLFRLLVTIDYDYDDIPIITMLTEYVGKLQNKKQQGNDEEDKKQLFLNSKLKDLFEIIKNVQSHIPFNKMLVLLSGDLLCKVMPIKYNYDITQIYKEYKNKVMTKIWDDYFTTLKRENLHTLLNQMFETNYTFNTLTYLTPKFKEKMEQYSYAHLPYIHLLNFMEEFLISSYKVKIELTVTKLINDGDFKKDKVRSDISSYCFVLNSFDKQIRDFDNKYNPNHDTGKELYSLLNRVLENDNSGGPFLTSIDDVNTECYKFVSDMKKAFKEIQQFLTAVNDIHNPHNIPIVNSEKIKIPGQPNLYVAVENALNIFNNYQTIIGLINDIIE